MPEDFAHRRILITGAAGFIGRALARYFTHNQYQVYGIGRASPEDAPLTDLGGYIQTELPSPLFAELLKQWQPNIILHCAGRASVPGAMEDPLSDFRDGPALTFSLLTTIRDILPECALIFLSSAAVYGNPQVLPVSESVPPNPISAYGYHKWQSEIVCQEYAKLWNMKTASVRIFSAYGPGLRRQVLWDIVYKALTEPEVRLQGTGQESRDFIHVQDIARGLEILFNNAIMQGEVYNLASGRETKIGVLATLILKQLNTQSKSIFSGEMPIGTPKNWRADIQKISALGFSHQVTLEEGVGGFVEWARREIEGV